MMQRRQCLQALPVLGLAATWRSAGALPPPSPAPSWTATPPRVPDLNLLDHRGQPVSLRPLLASGVVAVNFIYTGCASFCPPQTAVFRHLQTQLPPADGLGCHLVSISINPLADTPQALRRYAERYEARLGPSERWTMLTGTVTDVAAVLTGFGIHGSSLLDHPSQTWIGCETKHRWTRVMGLAPAADLLQWMRVAAS